LIKSSATERGFHRYLPSIGDRSQETAGFDICRHMTTPSSDLFPFLLKVQEHRFHHAITRIIHARIAIFGEHAYSKRLKSDKRGRYHSMSVDGRPVLTMGRDMSYEHVPSQVRTLQGNHTVSDPRSHEVQASGPGSFQSHPLDYESHVSPRTPHTSYGQHPPRTPTRESHAQLLREVRGLRKLWELDFESFQARYCRTYEQHCGDSSYWMARREEREVLDLVSALSQFPWSCSWRAT